MTTVSVRVVPVRAPYTRMRVLAIVLPLLSPAVGAVECLYLTALILTGHRSPVTGHTLGHSSPEPDRTSTAN